jgi:hypothetical protein
VVTVLGVFEQALLLCSLALFVGFVLWHSVHGARSMELLLRVAALFAGAMVVVGSQAAGLSFAQFSVQALSSARAGGAAAVAAAAVVPGVVGLGVGWYLTHSMHRGESIAIRVMAFVGMLAAAEFASIYAVAVHEQGVNLGATALPNITFVVGVFLYMILRYDTDHPRGKRPSGVSQGLGHLLGGFRGHGGSVPQSSAQTVSSLFREANEAASRRGMAPAGPGVGEGVSAARRARGNHDAPVE